MQKNGKNIKCKFCSKVFYISGSRIGTKKYCSVDCARADDYGFRGKTKNCICCGNRFRIEKQIRSGDKTCSQECRYKMSLARSREQSERKKNRIEIKRCRNCGKEVVSNAYCPRSFCGGVGSVCHRKFLSDNRKGSNNPAYRNGFYKNGNKSQTSKHLRACAKYRKDMIEKYGYQFCESCGVNQNGTMRFEVHHIYYASLYPRHKELHNKKNLINLCIQCHNDFHSSKRKEEFQDLEKKRGLKKLFGCV